MKQSIAEMRNLLLVLRTPPPYGGGEILQEALLKYYNGRGKYQIITLTSKQRDKGNQGLFRFWKLFEFLHLLQQLVRVFLTSRPRLLFFAIGKAFPHFLRDSILIWLTHLFRIPVAAEVHGSTFYFLENNRILRWYARLVLNHVVSLRVLGETSSRQLRMHGINNTVVIENGVEVPVNGLRQVSGRPTVFRFLFVGTIGEHKGFDLVIDACAALLGRLNEFQVHCMGQWMSREYEKTVQARLRQEGLLSRFVFHGMLHDEAKWSVFRMSDALILPSYNEGQPLVILEAFFFGLAVIATAVGAIPDTVEMNVNGFLIAPGDSKALGDMMYRLTEDKDECSRIQEANRNLFSARYSLPAFLEKHERWLLACAANETNINDDLACIDNGREEV